MRSIIKWLVFSLITISLALLAASYTPSQSLDELKVKYSYPDSKFMAMDGMQIHFRDVGTGPVVVLLHGLSSSLHTWKQWSDILAKKHRVISVDLPGFGLTGPFMESDDYSEEAYVDWLRKFLRRLKVQQFSLAGNSFGGHIAWYYATVFSRDIEKLILVDPAGFPLDHNRFNIFRFAGTPGLSWLVENFTPYAIVSRSVYRVYGDTTKVTPALIQRYYDILLRPGNRTALVKRMRALNWSGIERIGSIQKPTAIMWGTEDKLIPYSHAKRYLNSIRGSVLFEYPGVGHLPMEEIPQRSGRDALNFLSQSQ
jgi:pimeloyl-ACP methyl ester carboxylesterase